MPNLIMLVGPPGSGKSTLAKQLIHEDGDHGSNTVYVSQDKQGKIEHVEIFNKALAAGKDIIVDRMNFNKEQRSRYISRAGYLGYEIKIRVLHQPYKVCLERASNRIDHETIKDVATAEKAISMFFKKYERVEDDEADEVIRYWPEGYKKPACIIDLDGTLCNIDHRLHHVRKEGKKDWKAFMEDIPNDSVNEWCKDIINKMHPENAIVLCSGRSEDEREATKNWLSKHNITYDHLFMRQSGDYRKDSVVKEILLDFEILCRFEPYFMLDDRTSVVNLWRRRGYVCLQCAPGEF